MFFSLLKCAHQKIRERTKVRLSSLVDDHLLSRLIDQWRATVDWLSSAFIFFECSPERNPRIDHHCLLLSRHYCNGEEKKVIYIIQGVVIVFFPFTNQVIDEKDFFFSSGHEYMSKEKCYFYAFFSPSHCSKVFSEMKSFDANSI